MSVLVPGNLLPLLGLALAFAGCAGRPPVPAGSGQTEEKKAAAAVQPGSSDCVRGEPDALLSSQSEFKQLEPHEAQEAVHTGSAIALTIHHFGCAHYALDFEFKWPDPRMPEPRVSLTEAAGVLETLPVKAAYQPVIKSLVAAMRKMALEPYKQPMTMSETETLTATTPSLNVLRVRYDVAL